MATAKQLPSGNWRVRVYVGKKKDGTPKYKSITAETKKEAERQAAMYEYKEEKAKANGLTVGQVIEQYISNNSNVLSPSSIRKYDSMSRNNFGSIKDKYVKDLKRTDYQAFVNELALDYAPKSVASISGLLTAAVNAYDPDINLSLKRPQVRKENIIIPTEKQIVSMVEAAGSPEMELAFILGAALGLRRSEIAALTWKDVDGNILHINKAMVQDKKNKWVIKSTKTEAGDRDVDIPQFIMERLNAIKSQDTKDTDFIFPFTPSAITMRFYKVSKEAGINCRFHDLRHYNASVMLALGVPDKYAMKRMGHATPNMLKTVYQHLIDEKEKAVATDVNTYMDSKLNAKH